MKIRCVISMAVMSFARNILDEPVYSLCRRVCYFLLCFYLLLLGVGMAWTFPAEQVVFIFVSVFLICASSVYWAAKLYLLSHNIRKPLREESERLTHNFLEVCRRCNEQRTFDLLVDERDELSAYALGTRTIVISKAMLNTLPDAELQGVMAHELGHLRSFDGAVQSFVITTGWMALAAEKTGRLLWRCCLHMLTDISLLPFGIILFILLVYCLKINVALFFVVFVLWIILSLMRIFFHFAWLAIMRMTEYRQDAFAASLGYATDLRRVLYRLLKDGAGDISVWHTLRRGTHPMIYNRIRKLETYMW